MRTTAARLLLDGVALAATRRYAMALRD